MYQGNSYAKADIEQLRKEKMRDSGCETLSPRPLSTAEREANAHFDETQGGKVRNVSHGASKINLQVPYIAAFCNGEEGTQRVFPFER